MLFSSELKSDYFRIEMKIGLTTRSALIGLKSDYFRIEM